LKINKTTTTTPLIDWNLEPNCYPIVGAEYGPFRDLKSVPEAGKKKSEKHESEN
jgi:hypothetical protein